MTDGAKTIEYWSGTRRVLYTPCSETDIYIALTMLDSDTAAKAVPVRKDEWKRAFPHLEILIDRIGDQGRYDRFDMIKLKRWSAGRVALIGDAAHALPPNIGQGGGCAMMNALSLAVYLEREDDIGVGARHHGSVMSGRSPSTPSASRIFLACRRPGRRRCAPSRSALPAAPNGWCASARGPRCTGRRERKNAQNGMVMPSSGASQLTKSTRFQAIMMPEPARTRP